MKKENKSRRHSREMALQTLCAIFLRNEANLDQERTQSIKDLTLSMFDEDSEEEQNQASVDYAIELIDNVLSNKNQIDDIITQHVVGWNPDRMGLVDRAIISIAIYEGLISQNIPVAVAISEAVELAKDYGSDKSGKFVNGSLAKINREYENAESQTSDTER